MSRCSFFHAFHHAKFPFLSLQRCPKWFPVNPPSSFATPTSGKFLGKNDIFPQHLPGFLRRRKKTVLKHRRLLQFSPWRRGTEDPPSFRVSQQNTGLCPSPSTSQIAPLKLKMQSENESLWGDSAWKPSFSGSSPSILWMYRT